MFVAVFGFVGMFLLKSEKKSGEPLEEAASTWNIFSNSGDSGSSGTVTNIAVGEKTSEAQDTVEGVRYVNSSYGFSLIHPKNMSATTLDEEDGETILIQEKEGTKSFQIFIMPWDEPEYTVITPKRIKQDLLDFVVDDPKEAVLADGTHALLFWSKEDGSGKTREVWIIHGEYLYQISALADLDSLLARIMGTWKFE